MFWIFLGDFYWKEIGMNEWNRMNMERIFFCTHTCTRPLAAQTHMREIDS